MLVGEDYLMAIAGIAGEAVGVAVGAFVRRCGWVYHRLGRWVPRSFRAATFWLMGDDNWIEQSSGVGEHEFLDDRQGLGLWWMSAGGTCTVDK